MDGSITREQSDNKLFQAKLPVVVLWKASAIPVGQPSADLAGLPNL
jgi:hypothetical protein